MNKITIDNKDINIDIDDSLLISFDDESKFLDVTSVKIKVLKDTTLIIDSCDSDIKLDFCFNILDAVSLELFEVKNRGEYKYQFKYYLDKNSKLCVQKLHDVSKIKEMNMVNLNGENAEINFILKTVCKDKEKYNFMVYHNAKKTISNIVNNGVNILDGELEFNVSSFIPKGIKKCETSQKNRIVNLVKKKCTIKPNLFIDEEDVCANHSAYIGNFSYDELFYLMSRGICKNDAINLLIKGFLIKDVFYDNDFISHMIDRYWG
ncbi:MAG: SufD family Fe-S cluster assembly protein [Bacilli bacterium]|nr:SufD family Fe-S cluster assembly protein [Bacilli bacterium]